MNSQNTKTKHKKEPKPTRAIFKVLKRHKLRTLMIIAVLMVVLFSPLFSSTAIRSEAIRYDRKQAQDATVELGDSVVRQAGSNGENAVKYKVRKSLFNLIFGGGQETIMSTSAKSAPVQELVVTGTRKYQYMYCSNGSYRFYTDEQFKDPNTGFTQKSPDDCARNNSGTKTQLADGAPGSNKVANITPYIPSNCSKSPIPYTTSYQNVSYPSPGVTSSYGGYDGYRVTCSPDSSGNVIPGYTIQPINKIVNVGVGSATTPSTPTQNNQARQKCISDYNAVIAQLRLGNAMNSSAKTYADQLYAQCLSRAGY